MINKFVSPCKNNKKLKLLNNHPNYIQHLLQNIYQFQNPSSQTAPIIPLTKLANVREDFMFSWMGESWGGLTPILAASVSTYPAHPRPRTSPIVFPRAAAAIVERVMNEPNVSSMQSPYITVTIRIYLQYWHKCGRTSYQVGWVLMVAPSHQLLLPESPRTWHILVQEHRRKCFLAQPQPSWKLS